MTTQPIEMSQIIDLLSKLTVGHTGLQKPAPLVRLHLVLNLQGHLVRWWGRAFDLTAVLPLCPMQLSGSVCS